MSLRRRTANSLTTTDGKIAQNRQYPGEQHTRDTSPTTPSSK